MEGSIVYSLATKGESEYKQYVTALASNKIPLILRNFSSVQPLLLHRIALCVTALTYLRLSDFSFNAFPNHRGERKRWVDAVTALISTKVNMMLYCWANNGRRKLASQANCY